MLTILLLFDRSIHAPFESSPSSISSSISSTGKENQNKQNLARVTRAAGRATPIRIMRGLVAPRPAGTVGPLPPPAISLPIAHAHISSPIFFHQV
jgi:hypothetical protein